MTARRHTFRAALHRTRFGTSRLSTYESAHIKNLRVVGAGRVRRGVGALHIHAARRAHYELFQHIIKLSDVFVNLGK